MHIFQSTRNTRPIIENSFRYIRSDVPTEITEEEKDWLLTNNVTTIVDLRTKEERVRKHCPLIDDNRFSYYVFSVAGGDKVPSSTDDVSKACTAMVDVQFDAMIEFLLNRKSNVLYFCNAGKDRTGVVSALLLKKLGVKEDVIVEDYMMSKENLLDMLTAYVKEHPEVDIEIIIPQEENIKKVLRFVEDNRL